MSESHTPQCLSGLYSRKALRSTLVGVTGLILRGLSLFLSLVIGSDLICIRITGLGSKGASPTMAIRSFDMPGGSGSVSGILMTLFSVEEEVGFAESGAASEDVVGVADDASAMDCIGSSKISSLIAASTVRAV